MIEITSKIVKTDVTCLKFFNKYLLAGLGGNLNVFSENGQIIQVYKVFDGEKVHGIVPNQTNKIAVFGANILTILEFDFIRSQISKSLAIQFCDDWIFSVQWLDSDTQLACVFAKNFVSLWSANDLKNLENVGCEEKCILYSATLVNNSWKNLFILSGTVFGQILIWKTIENLYISPVLWRLEGHDGAIFSIIYDKQSNIIASTSDDRTVRLWQLNKNIFLSHYNENEVKITQKHTLYGHIARIFRCKIAKNLVITAGEDSFVHFWHLHDGKLVRKFETHQNGCIWSLDYCPDKDLLATGGGDSGISLYPVHLINEIKVCASFNKDTPKSLTITADGNCAIIMDSGLLKYYKLEQNLCEDIHLHSDLKSYAILSTTKSRNLISLAGLQGSIHIYKEQNSGLIKICAAEDEQNCRIFSFHWLSSKQFLTTTVEGVMFLWNLTDEDGQYVLRKLQMFILPVCKERWATCACLCSENRLIVGDRKGNIHLYETTNANAIQSIKKAHCYLGVTLLEFADNKLISLGRNGIINKYSFQQTTQLSLVSKDKLPFSWLASTITYNNQTLLLGFSGANFIIFNLFSRRIILEINCGGGHRSWDATIAQNQLNFLYFKEKKLHFFSEKLSNILTTDLISGYHTKEINCGAVIKINEFRKQMLFISGGEDTTIRLSSVSGSQFSTISTIKSHLSSVRCIKVCLLENNDYLIFSGGGRAQIILQYLSIDNFECRQFDSYYKQLDESRIMDFAVINLKENRLLFAACSDGNVKCFLVNIFRLKLELICNIFYATKCIIKLSYIQICNKHVIISTATDGKLVFWDVSDLCNNITNKLFNFKPFYSIQSHQNGINSIDYKILNDNIVLFSTGGDDNAIVLNVIRFDCVPNLTAKKLTNKLISEAHFGQVTGIYIHNNFIISSSIDQQLSIFKYELIDNVLNCIFLKQFSSAVSDLQGMQCISNDNEIYAFLYGKGIDICNINGFS